MIDNPYPLWRNTFPNWSLALKHWNRATERELMIDATKGADLRKMEDACRNMAQEMGHKVGRFRPANPSVKTALCEFCGGCCWVAYSPTRGVGGGGRILKYKCGTPEAAGLKP